MKRALETALAELDPGAFACVMATGIVSIALDRGAGHTASTVLFAISLTAYTALLLLHGWRLARWPRRVAADLTGPQGFTSLTLVAGTNVLASRFVLDKHTTPAAALLGIGTLFWLLLDYGVPLALLAGRRRTAALDHVNGTWFLWVVGTQSVAVAGASLATLHPNTELTALAAICWAIGLMQYLLIAALVLARLLVGPNTPNDINAPYWIFMGAAAISVLAGAKLLELPTTDSLLPRSVIHGICGVLWAFCTWLIPLLLTLGIWRHLVHRLPLRYEAGLWSVIFPLGMYGVATHELGHTTHTHWLTNLGAGEERVAAVAWTAVFAAMLVAGTRYSRKQLNRTPAHTISKP